MTVNSETEASSNPSEEIGIILDRYALGRLPATFKLMKYLTLVLFSCLAVFAQPQPVFMTGQAARATIGQVTFTSQDSSGPSAYQIGAVSGIAYANNTLFVVDSNHIQADPVLNRVLIYTNLSSLVKSPTAELQQGIRCPVCVGTPDVGGASIVLGQPDFATFAINLTQNGLRTPSGIATDGKILAVADTDNNRVLIWKSIPTTNNQNADIVVGQPDFTHGSSATTATGMRGPQGVWIQGSRLFVADTQNSRVLVWNNIPSQNGQAADYVLGEPNLNTAPPATSLDVTPTSSNMFSPVSVTSDGQRLLVTDLGHSRVLIWNTIPTTTAQAADLVIGQPDMTSEIDNNSPALCPSDGTDDMNNATYPQRCYATLSFPRFALSDGQHLFIADGGNDRVLVYTSFPTKNGQPANIVLGQPDEATDLVTDSTDTFRLDANILSSSPNTIRTPMSLAWDGTNLYVSDPYDRRVMVFTLGLGIVPVNGITNAASRAVYAVGAVTFSGTITAGDVLTITINTTDYAYTVVKDDTLATIIQAMADLINGKKSGSTPDPNVVAIPNTGFNELVLTSRVAGPDGNNITYAVTTAGTSTSTPATETLTAASAALSGGQNAAEVAPGALIAIDGAFLSETTAVATPDVNGFYPGTLAGTQVYLDGIRAPLVSVSPTEIIAQIPFEVADSTGVSAVVRTQYQSGLVTNSIAVSVPIVPIDPGIFAQGGTDPRPVIAYHYSNKAIALISVDGTINPGDTATVGIEDRNYTYTVQATDTTATVRDALISLINSNPDEKLVASPSQQFSRIVLTAKVTGPDGNGIKISGTNSTNADIVITALNGSTCCASVAGARVTADNPAVPGEVVTVYATGIGIVSKADGTPAAVTGQAYMGPAFNSPNVPVDNAQVGGLTANVINSGLVPGMLGIYQVDMQLDGTLPTNPNTQMYIAQNVFTSNIVTIPVVAPAPPAQ